VLSWAIALVVVAQAPAEQQLERARTCFSALDFSCASETLAGLREKLAALSPELVREILVLDIEVMLSTERWNDAQHALVELLQREPGFVPKAGAWPPEWEAVLAKARRRAPDPIAPEVLEIIAPPASLRRQPIAVQARIRDNVGVRDAKLRLIDPAKTIPMATTDGLLFEATIPAESTDQARVAFEIHARDETGNEATPLASSVALSEEDVAVTSRWWFWTLVGAAAVAAIGVGVGAGTASDDSGIVEARISWPTR